MKIAVIDSGISEDVMQGKLISQHRVYNGNIYKEAPFDYIGHGTAVASVLAKNNNCKIISICPGINEKGEVDKIILPVDIAISIELAINLGAKIINISMGTTAFFEKEKMDKICNDALNKGVLIVCAESTESIPSLPWACSGVVRVRAIDGKTYGFRLSRNDKVPSIEVEGEIFKIKTREGNKYFATGNSYAAPFFINKVVEMFDRENEETSLRNIVNKSLYADKYDDVFEYLMGTTINLVKCKPDSISTEQVRLGNIILVPFSKEMHVIIRNREYLGAKICGVIDPIKQGNFGKDPGILLGELPIGVEINTSIGKITQKVDKVIIGYLEEIQKLDRYFNLDNILEENLNTIRADIFTLTPPNEKWIEIYDNAGIKLEYPTLINKDTYNKLKMEVPYITPTYKPVIGVFGTSSAQGKVTLQMNIKRAFENQGISPFYISTEHQGSILGANFTFASGYANNNTISLDSESCIDYIQRIISYGDNISGYDMFLVGSQSWIVPFYKEQTFMRSAIFLEGVKPDLAILVINPLLDPHEYIIDTINVLKGIYKCKTVAICFSDKTPKLNKHDMINKNKLSDSDIKELSDELSKTFKCPVGCIMDEHYINKIAKNIIGYCE